MRVSFYAFVGLLAVAPVSAQQPASARVLIVTAAIDDERVELVRDAVRFWNRTFTDLGLSPVLTDAGLLVAPPSLRVFENYSRRIWQRAGRVGDGPYDPEPPPEILELESDLVVFLSSQPLMPFAWPMSDGNRYFIALADLEASRMDPNNAHNVVAHELGHAMGLSHAADPTSLMCLPCQPQPARDGYLPLTAADRLRLQALYRASP
ncbi:MAG: matrixin family metalloprotease [Thermoanaerobaculia bacterium]|nr:matrixin family metalloprotease [Thermoanaerobaculia bacterium]